MCPVGLPVKEPGQLCPYVRGYEDLGGPRPSHHHARHLGLRTVRPEDGGRQGVHAAALLAELDSRQAPCEYTGLRVSQKTRLLQAVSASVHGQFKAQLVLSRGLLRP